jgi:hypothetical protein
MDTLVVEAQRGLRPEMVAGHLPGGNVPRLDVTEVAGDGQGCAAADDARDVGQTPRARSAGSANARTDAQPIAPDKRLLSGHQMILACLASPA